MRLEHRHLSQDQIAQVVRDVRSLHRIGQHELALELFQLHFNEPYKEGPYQEPTPAIHSKESEGVGSKG